MERDTGNSLFNLAVDFVCYSNQSLFLTGKAGTGKTTFLKYIREHCRKKMAVTAPTGVAAINAGGVTLHSFFQLPFGTYLSDMKSGWNAEASQQHFYNRKQLLSNLRLRQKQREVIQSLELLIIDEVSMVRADLLDAIDTILRSVRKRPERPFGGVQLLLIGDLYQLPPVVTQEEKIRLYDYYKSPFFFDAKVLETFDLITLTLQKIYRQQDAQFIGLLNKIRNNICEENDFQFLNKCYHPTFVPDEKEGYITLTTHNKIAASLNASALERLPGKLVEIGAKIEQDFPENAFPADVVLRLKTGAQIMFIKNDVGEKRRYFNGKIGIIKKIDSENKTIEITFSNEQETILITPETWDNIRYEYDREKDEVKEKTLGSFSQFPIRLAWAITIHKSQGLTFEKAVIDAGRSFAAGQVYVALSRMTGISGLILHSRITQESIQTDSRMQQFIGKEPEITYLKKVLESAQFEYASQLLLSSYDWNELEDTCIEYYKYVQTSGIPNKEQALQKAAGWLDAQSAVKNVAQKFAIDLGNYLRKKDFKRLKERNFAAVKWFSQKVENDLKEIKQHIQTQTGKQKTKKYVQALQDLATIFEQKKIMLEKSNDLSESLSESEDIREAMIRFNTPKIALVDVARPIGKPQKGDSKKVSLALFRSGKSVEMIAKERGLAESTILGHLTTFIETGEVSYKLFLDQEEALEIMEAVGSAGQPTSGMLKNKFGARFTYPQIHAALALLKFKENKNEVLKK